MNKQDLIMYVRAQLYHHSKIVRQGKDQKAVDNSTAKIIVLQDIYSQVKRLDDELTFTGLYYRNNEWEENTKLKIVIPSKGYLTRTDEAYILLDEYDKYPVRNFTRNEIILREPES